MDTKIQMDYRQEQAQNFDHFKELVKAARPDIYVLMNLIDQFQINPAIIFKYIYHLSDVGLHGYGKVDTHIENKVVTFIRGEKSDRINEPVTNQEVNNEQA